MTFNIVHNDNLNAPIVALHSSASNGGQWRQLDEELNGRYSIHAPDLPGYQRKGSQHLLAADATDYVVQLITSINQPIHLVGHSNGGRIAMNVALRRPDLIKSLTLYEPAIFHILSRDDAKGQQLHHGIRQIAGIVTASASTGEAHHGMKHFLDFWNGVGFWDSLPAQSQAKFADKITSVLSDFNEGFSDFWSLEDLRRLDVPALLMMGLESPDVSQRATTLLANALPNSRIALLPELGHMAPVFHPQWINPRIIEHISSVERQASGFSWPNRIAA
ncbi:MAG: alpha/beta hydrolase [Pseudomonadota bacterium]